MADETSKHFETKTFLATAEEGRSIVRRRPKQSYFVQGAPADDVYYLKRGRAKLTVMSKRGKEATVAMLAGGDFFGEESMSGIETVRSSTAEAITSCVAIKIAKVNMLRVLHEEPTLSDLFLQFVLKRGIRAQADLVDQLLNSSERRLARTLLIMAEYGRPGAPETLIPPISQATLAEMIGSTRSRVSFFMNRFRALGYIEYDGRIRVHTSLLNMVLYDGPPAENASRINAQRPHLPQNIRYSANPI